MNQQKWLVGKSVLIIEDNQFFAEVTGHVLQREGVNIYFAANRLQALQQLACYQFDAVLCDYNIPDVIGSELLAEIIAVCATPIILCSGQVPNELNALLEWQQVSSFISKPFTRATIITALEQVLVV